MNNLYQQITDSIIKEMEKGELPWNKPWLCTGLIVSHATGKPYSLLNRLLLKRQGEYATFRQVQDAGGQVKKGAKAEKIYFFRPLITTTETEVDGKTIVKQKTSLMFRYYNVFHISDCEGLEPKWTKNEQPSTSVMPEANAEWVAHDYLTREGIDFRQDEIDEAWFAPNRNLVQVPPIKCYNSASDYYGVLFHELTHSTGTKNRLGRLNEDVKLAAFGSGDYSKEELVAELGSAMMLAELGIGNKTTHTQSAAYIQNWLKVLKNDVQMVVSAASKAEKAVNYILGRTTQEVA